MSDRLGFGVGTTATPQDIGTGLTGVERELKRIANALERLVQAYPTCPTVQKDETTTIQDHPPMVPPPTDIVIEAGICRAGAEGFSEDEIVARYKKYCVEMKYPLPRDRRNALTRFKMCSLSVQKQVLGVE